MIGFLQGKVLDTDGKKLILLTDNGVGYEVNYTHFVKAETVMGVFIHHQISENDQSLWGFNSLKDKRMFELLKTVNKVGSSKAYPLISVVGTKAVIEAIMFDQPNVLSAAPGIGKKMAEQIILSLKDKIDKFYSAATVAKVDGELSIETAELQQTELLADNENIYNDVILALDSLGYKDNSISSMVKKHISSGISNSEEIIKTILKEL